jgi:hypothetical protein
MNEVGNVVAARASELAKSTVKRRISTSSQGKSGKYAQQEDIEADILDAAAKFVDLRLSMLRTANHDISC